MTEPAESEPTDEAGDAAEALREALERAHELVVEARHFMHRLSRRDDPPALDEG